jgi:hypothetical protein
MHGSPSKLKDRTFRATFHFLDDGKLQRANVRRVPRLYRNPVILAQAWQQAITSGEYHTRAEFARRQGISRARVTQVLNLMNLAPDVLDTIAALSDPLCSRTITERVLRSLVRRSEDEQCRAISKLLARSSQRPDTPM